MAREVSADEFRMAFDAWRMNVSPPDGEGTLMDIHLPTRCGIGVPLPQWRMSALDVGILLGSMHTGARNLDRMALWAGQAMSAHPNCTHLFLGGSSVTDIYLSHPVRLRDHMAWLWASLVMAGCVDKVGSPNDEAEQQVFASRAGQLLEEAHRGWLRHGPRNLGILLE